MDEVFLIASERCPWCKGGDPARLFAKAVSDLHAPIVGKRRLEMLNWGDRLLDAGVVGYGERESAKNGTHRAIDLVPKDLIVCDWHYEKMAEHQSIPLLLERDFRVWPSGWNKLEHTEALIAATQKNRGERMLGHLCTTWGAVKFPQLAEWPPSASAMKRWAESGRRAGGRKPRGPPGCAGRKPPTRRGTVAAAAESARFAGLAFYCWLFGCPCVKRRRSLSVAAAAR